MKKFKVITIQDRESRTQEQEQELITNLENDINKLAKNVKDDMAIVRLLNILKINWTIEEV